MKLKLTYKNDNPTGKWRSFNSKACHVKLNGKRFASVNEKSVLDRSDSLNWRIQICVLNDKEENCAWKWLFVKQTFATLEDAKTYLETNIEKICNSFILWMIDEDKTFDKEIMRVAKKCTQCRKLKSRLDFPVDDSHEGRGPVCDLCISGVEDELEELNSKIVNKNNPLKINTMSLKEKREAAAKAAAAEAAKKTAKPASKKVEETKPAKKATPAPVEEPKKAVKKSAPAPEPAKPASKKPEAKPTAKVEEKVEEAKPAKTGKVKPKISQYDLATGKLIKTHKDVDAAAASVGKHKKYIDINGKNKSVSAYGFKWLYEGYEMPEEEPAGEVKVEEKVDKKADKKSKAKAEPIVEDEEEEDESEVSEDDSDEDEDFDESELEDDDDDEFIPEDEDEDDDEEFEDGDESEEDED